MFLQSERQFFVYSVLPNKLVQMDSEATKSLIDADESEDDLNDIISTTSSRSRSKDGRFVNELRQTVHPCPYSDCIKYFTRPSRLQTHLLTHTGDRPYKCLEDGCMKSYSRAAHLKRHTIKSHSSTDPDTPNVILHSVGSDAKTIRCNVCPKLFSNKYSLQKHLKVHQDSLRYTCIECNQSFTKHHLLKSHNMEHKSGTEKEAPISCSKCERKFVYASQLQKHLTRHENRKEYKCEKCEEIFTKWTELRSHMSSAHEKSSKNSCELCKKVFTGPYAKENLRAHRVTHATNRKIFSCPIEPCTRFYYFEKNLKDHIAGYHKGKRLPCLEVGCHARLSSRRKLIQHNAKIHGEAQEPSMCSKEKERAARKDKGTHKIPMATLLSGVVEESTLQVDRDPSPSGLLQRLDSKVNAVALKSDLSLKSATSTLIDNEKPIYLTKQMIKKKRKEMYGKRLFGPGADVPMFNLPGSTRTHLLMKKSFLQKEKGTEPISANPNSAPPNSSPPNIANKEASQMSTNMKNLDASHKSQAGVKSLHSRKVDFSKYVVISTSTYKST